MGYYINKDSKGNALPPHGKVRALIADGAHIIEHRDGEFEENLVCVVDNGMFEAAGYAFNADEMEAFEYPDGRYRTWLVYEHARMTSGCKE